MADAPGGNQNEAVIAGEAGGRFPGWQQARQGHRMPNRLGVLELMTQHQLQVRAVSGAALLKDVGRARAHVSQAADRVVSVEDREASPAGARRLERVVHAAMWARSHTSGDMIGSRARSRSAGVRWATRASVRARALAMSAITGSAGLRGVRMIGRAYGALTGAHEGEQEGVGWAQHR